MSLECSVEILCVSIQRAIPFQNLHLHDIINPSRWIPTVLFIVYCCIPYLHAVSVRLLGWLLIRYLSMIHGTLIEAHCIKDRNMSPSDSDSINTYL